MLSALRPEVSLHFRNQLRAARAVAARDAEAFHEIVFVLERIGAYLANKGGSLGAYLPLISAVASHSIMADTVPKAHPAFHQRFEVKYDLVRRARNAALHEGAFARHLTANAIELSLVLEDAMMTDHHQVSDFMVRNPVCASLWQPLSFIRQTMLVNAYSYLPVSIRIEGGSQWRLISDFQLGKYVRSSGKDPRDVLTSKLEECISFGKIELQIAKTCEANETVASVFGMTEGAPILVMAPNGSDLLGILTAFDLL
jgi:hypothetical protein